MKKRALGSRHLGWAVVLGAAVSFGLVGPSNVGVANAKPKKEKKDKDEVDPNKPAPVKRAPKFKPKGLNWGMDHDKVYDVYTEVIERDYLPRYKEVEPGVQTERLKDEIRRKKQAFKLSHIEFRSPPTKLDGTDFEGEFTYGNDEAMMRIKRKGRERTLFFIKDKLWKTIDVYRLGKGSKWGADFASATARIEKILKQEGRKIYTDEEKSDVAEVDWSDGKVHVRLINFGKKEVAVSFVHVATEKKIGKLRKNKDGKNKGKNGVEDFLRTPKDASGGKDDDKKKKKK